MAEAENKEAAKPAEPPKASGGASRLVPVLLGVNTLALAAIAATLALQLRGARAEAHAAEPAAEHARAAPAAAAGHDAKGGAKEALPGPTLRLADFVVHLHDADADRYLRASFELELTDEKAKEAVTARLPQIRDSFLSYLSDRSSDELRGSEAIARVKGALSQRLGEVAPPTAVRALYLTELVVQ